MVQAAENWGLALYQILSFWKQEDIPKSMNLAGPGSKEAMSVLLLPCISSGPGAGGSKWDRMHEVHNREWWHWSLQQFSNKAGKGGCRTHLTFYLVYMAWSSGWTGVKLWGSLKRTATFSFKKRYVYLHSESDIGSVTTTISPIFPKVKPQLGLAAQLT